jgi:hypothetical protein
MTDDVLPIAHRVWAEPVEEETSRPRQRRKRSEPNYVLVFDTETTVDHRQSLTFGVWRYYRVDEDSIYCADEGMFHADELGESDPEGMGRLIAYVSTNRAQTERDRAIRAMTRSQFVEQVLFRVIEADGRIVAFNLAFDLSRLAIEVTDARGVNHGGHSFVLAKPKPGTSHHKERKHRPRIVIKHRDAKGSFISTTKPMGADDWSGGRGRFLDLRTLAFAVTGEAYSLDGACRAFGVPGKLDTGGHGHITPEYIDYCRQDVAATAGLYSALMAEFRLHPIDLEPERAYSPASLSKAYLSAMGIKPILERQRSFPREVLGYAMAAFFGGRAECRIRRVPTPVRLYDFTSMYPTVGALMDLHRFQLASRIIVDEITAEEGDQCTSH